MVSPASVLESSSLQTASVPPTALARSCIARQAVVPVLPVSAENLRVDALFHCRGTATEAAVGYNGFRLRCDLRVRAGMHCAPPRLQSGRSRAVKRCKVPRCAFHMHLKVGMATKGGLDRARAIQRRCAGTGDVWKSFNGGLSDHSRCLFMPTH